MAPAELPSYYGQKTKDGISIQHPSRKMDNSGTTDMAYNGNGNGQSSREKPVDEMADISVRPGLRGPRKSSFARPGMNRMPSVVQELRLPWTKWMDSNSKNHFVAFISEFVGTTMFLFFAFAGTQVANVGASTTGATAFNPTVYLYIAVCFGFSLMVNAWVFFRVSGGLFNPAVTLALCLLKAIGVGRAICVFIAQLTGACFAAYLVKVIFPVPLNVRTTLGEGTTIAQGIFIEAVCSAELIFTIIMLAMEKHKATFIAPVGIGLSLFIGELCAVYYTGGSLNPARSFGPSAVTHTFSHNDWIYWVGPLMGSLFAVVFYRFIKVLEYEMANPGQDDDVAAQKPSMISEIVHKLAHPGEHAHAEEGARTESNGETSRADEHDGDNMSPQTSPTNLLPRDRV